MPTCGYANSPDSHPSNAAIYPGYHRNAPTKSSAAPSSSRPRWTFSISHTCPFAHGHYEKASSCADSSPNHLMDSTDTNKKSSSTQRNHYTPTPTTTTDNQPSSCQPPPQLLRRTEIMTLSDSDKPSP